MLRTGDAMVRTDGVYNITNEEYHLSDDAYSRSALWLFKQSPKHYWHRYLNPDREPDKFNPNFLLGELVHCLVLEPNEYKSRYVIEPKLLDVPKLTLLKDLVLMFGKEHGRDEYETLKKVRQDLEDKNRIIKDGFVGLSHGKQVVPDAVHDEAHAMAKSVMATPTAKALFPIAEVEKSIYFTHKDTGLQLKVRPDAWIDDAVIDLKTTRDGSYRAFQNSAVHYGYFLQGAMIKAALASLGIDMKEFIFYCVEKSEPYASSCYIMSDEAMDYGTSLLNELVESFARCLDSRDWISYEPQILYTPAYLNKD